MLNKDILNIVGESIHEGSDANLEFFNKTFADIIKNKHKFKNAYLTLYIYEKFCKNKDVRTRKTSARDFEDFIAAISGGFVTDSSARHNINENKIFLENNFITEWVVINKREKADVVYNNGYKITIKTSVENNKEVNLGSFEKKALFSELGVAEFLEERKSSKDGIGLGSKNQVLKLLKLIENNGNWKKFSSRFNNMCKYTFSHDIILLIKKSKGPKLYLISSDNFNKKVISISKNPESFITLINRWEGNNLRINRDKLLEDIEPIILDFSYLNTHIVTQINNNLSLITKFFVLYIEDHQKKDEYRKEIKTLCEETLKEIDKEFHNLI